MQNNNKHYPIPQEYPMQTLSETQPQVSAVVYPSLQVGQPLPPPMAVQQPYIQQQAVYYGGAASPTSQPIQSKYPTIVTCNYCQRQVQTIVNYEAGNGAFVIGGIMAAVGLWLGCCLIPCFMQDCKDAIHFCPSCSAHIGRKKFLFD